MKDFSKASVSRRGFLGATGIAASFGLVACGKGSSSSDNDTTGGGAAEGGEGGGVITAGSAYSTRNFDPSTTSSALSLGTNWHVVEGLYGIDYHDYSTFPELATGDPKEIDDTTLEVTLRKDAKFSDGKAVTPEDIIESYNRANAENNFYHPMLAPIASIEKKDESTLTIKTTIPHFSLIKERLSIIRVVPASSTPDDMKAKPVGSGPWMYETIDDSNVKMVPNPNYNGEHAAKDTALNISVLKDATARINAQREGTTLAMEMVTADAVDQLKAAGCNIDTVQGFGTRFLMFNVKKAPWDKVEVRQAVMYALNYDQMISNAFAGMASAVTSYLPQNFPNYHRAATVYTQDVDKAKQLLQSAGVTPGDVTLRILDNEQVIAMSTQVKNDLDALGFNVTIKQEDTAATYQAIDQGEAYDMLLAPGDPSCFGADPDLLMNWWYGDNIWMKTRCPWNDSAEYQKLRSLMDQAMQASGSDQQDYWNQCFDLLAENCPLYPVLQVQTTTASWADTPNGSGVALKGFKGIGTTGMSFIDVTTTKA